MITLLAVFSEDNLCGKMDCASGLLGFMVALALVGIYHWGKSEGKDENDE